MEKIVGVAIKVNGELYSMLAPCRHADIYEWLHEANVDVLSSAICEGFVTNSGEFVNRHQAAKIAKKANQIISDDFVEYCLYSEDVW